MLAHELDEITACLPRGRTDFHYGKGDYALHVLRLSGAGGQAVSELKRSRLGRLTQVPAVRSVLAAAGSGHVRSEQLELGWDPSRLPFTLSVGAWSGHHDDVMFDQMSRPRRNLVLQLNFDEAHAREYRRLVRPYRERHPFVFWGHPVAQHAFTLAWARLDIDLGGREALIEELQSDWMSAADALRQRPPRFASDENSPRGLHYGWVCPGTDPEAIAYYCNVVLRPYRKLWVEAMLSAALVFLREELGIRRIYLHTWESGNWFKEQTWRSKPPREPYTDAPRRLCFERTPTPPKLLRKSRERWVRHKLADREVHWWRLRL